MAVKSGGRVATGFQKYHAAEGIAMIGAIISAGSSLLGGLLNKGSAERAQDIQRENALRQEALQKEFAQSGIQWKVADAQKAGIHPLYALGANTTSYSPVSVGSVADTSLGSAVAQSGQDISRGIEATRTRGERDSAYAKTVQDLSVKKMGLENELLAVQIAKQRAQIGPAMPALTDTNMIAGQPATRSVVLPGNQKMTTPAYETQQQKISDEYGDEGLPQLPGQYRFARDVAVTGFNDWWNDVKKGHNETFGNSKWWPYALYNKYMRPYSYTPVTRDKRYYYLGN